LWIKFFGSSVLAHKSTARIAEHLEKLAKDKELRQDIINYSLGGWKRQRRGPEAVVARWRAGLRALEQRFPGDAGNIRDRYR
jgi:hypothetical protein